MSNTHVINAPFSKAWYIVKGYSEKLFAAYMKSYEAHSVVRFLLEKKGPTIPKLDLKLKFLKRQVSKHLDNCGIGMKMLPCMSPF